MGILLIFFLFFVVCVAVLFAVIGGFVESLGEKACVECAETIKKDARKCKHCGAAQPEAAKAVTAVPAAQPNPHLMDKAARLKDSPELIALQTRLREEKARGETRRFWWGVTVTAFFVVSAAARGAPPGEIIRIGLLAGGIAVGAWFLLNALDRRKINEKYRAGVEGLSEPAAAMEREAG